MRTVSPIQPKPSTCKTARLDAVMEMPVQRLVAPGETIRVDVRTRKYAGKDA